MYKVEKNFFIGSKSRLFFDMSKIVSGATLFVEPDEFPDYFLMYGERFNVVKLKDNNKGFGYLLNSMLNYAVENRFNKYIFCDDDIFGFKFRDIKSNLLNEIDKMYKLIDDNKYTQLAMSFIGHNWYYDGMVKEKIGAWGFIANFTKAIQSVGGYDENLPIFNDWDMSAKLIKLGYKTACYYDAMFIHKMKSREGGASDIYKHKELLEEAEEMLRGRYGDKCITNKIIHNQKEIRFKWSKL